ncbi:MAG TPA: DUF2243 domain-containing protein [Burkholderiales bacterium]|nr:DUF2243 domain-containing protein [Burkholderiales bacterium]
MQATASSSPSFTRSFDWGAYALGIALGGFFDGILLHQLLQWHHLLSAVDTGIFSDLRGQVLADGLFHALMYLVAVGALWALLRTRAQMAQPSANRRLTAGLLIGFGIWHVLDAVLSHWLLGIHRIRVDVANPLPWDIAWVLVFGLVPIVIGLSMRKRAESTPPDHGAGVSSVTLSILLALTITAGLVSARPMPDTGTGGAGLVTVVLRPDVGPAQWLNTLKDDSRIVWSDPAGGVWVLQPGTGSGALDFYRHGALYVSGSLFPAGCFGWLKAA